MCRRGTLYRYMCDEMRWGLRRRKDGRTDADADGQCGGAAPVTTDATVMYGGAVGRFTSVAAAVVSGDSVREREEG